jgi:enterochelin esterase family protein
MPARAGRAPRGRVLWVTIESRVLRGNRARDPWVRRFPVYLPPGYESGAARYPLLLGLAPYGSTGPFLLNRSAWGEPLDLRLDRLYAAGRIGPMIVALPDCFTRYGGSQYLNSSATGRYEDHLLYEVIPYLDRHLRTLPRAAHRGLLGRSSGGYGALVHGMLHPEVFGAVACHSGDMGFEYCYWPDLPKLLQQLERHGGLRRFLAAFAAAPRKSGDMVAALSMVAMAACYSPNPRQPLGFDLPVNLSTGEPRPEVWRRWLAHDPLHLAPRHLPALRRLRLLYFDCGRRDEYHLQWGGRRLAATLREKGAPHQWEEFDDGHMDTAYRYDRSLPLLWEAVKPPARLGRRQRAPGSRAVARSGRRWSPSGGHPKAAGHLAPRG